MPDLLDSVRAEQERIRRGDTEPPAPVRPRSFLEQTGQMWKAWAYLAIGNLGGAFLMGSCLLNDGATRDDSWNAGTLLIAASLTFACLSMRCPRCRCRVAWYGWRHQMHGLVMRPLQHIVCPQCRFDPANAAATEGVDTRFKSQDVA